MKTCFQTVWFDQMYGYQSSSSTRKVIQSEDVEFVTDEIVKLSVVLPERNTTSSPFSNL